MRLRYAWIAILLLWLPSMVFAEVYRYTDEDGVQRVTDNLAQVPVDQREGIYENTEPAQVIPPQDLTVEAESLLKTKAELDQEYSALLKEREALESEPDTPLTNEEFEAYKDRIDRFNERRAAYEQRLKEFQMQVDAYHKRQALNVEAFNKSEQQKASMAESLVKTKAELDKEYSELMKEQEAIVSEGSESDVFSTTEAFEAYKERVADFNERRADYEKRAKAYQEKAEAFNQAQTQ